MDLARLFMLIALALFVWAALVAASWVDVGNYHVLLASGFATYVLARLPFWTDRRFL